MSFGQKLRAARKKRGMTQAELAQAVGARHNSVSNWEQDLNRPDTDTIRRLCDALQVDANELFEEKGLSDVEFALFGEVKKLSREDQQDVLEFIRFKRAMQEKRNGQ